MNIIMITGSPHKKGTSELLADEFERGALNAGHSVSRFDAAFMDIAPCAACDFCLSSGECCAEDNMRILTDELLKADAAVFVTPIYYFGMSAQLKRVIDRFYAVNSTLEKQKKRAVLLATCADDRPWVWEPLVTHFEAICRYLGWENSGELIASGVSVREDIEKTDCPGRAYELGIELRD